MNYTYRYNLLALRDYLWLLYAAFFNWSEIPQTEKRDMQTVLATQGLLLIVVANLIASIVVKLSGMQVEWSAMMFGVVVGVAVGVVVGVVGCMVRGVAIGVAFGVTIGVARGMAVGVSRGVSRGVVVGVVVGMTVGVVVGVSVGVAGMIGSWLGMLAGLAVAVFGGAIFFFIAITFAILVSMFFNHFKFSVRSDWWMGIGLLLILATAAGYLFYALVSWFNWNAPSPFVIAAAFALAYLRLPFWPIETIWAGVWSWWRLRQPDVTVESYVRVLKWAYFDRHILLPLPGEMTLLQRIQVLDHNRAIREAVDLSLFSNHLLPAVTALHSFARIDPASVQQAIIKRAGGNDTVSRLLRYVAHRLPDSAAQVWQAQQQVQDICRRVATARKQVVEQQRDKQDKTAVVSAVSQPQADSIASLDKIRQQIDRAVQQQPDLRYGSNLSMLYHTFHNALQAQDVATLGTCRWPHLPADAVFLFPKAMHNALDGLNDLAAIARSYSDATAPATRSNIMLEANVLVAEVEQLGDKLDGMYAPLLALVVDHWQGIFARESIGLVRTSRGEKITNPYKCGDPVRGDLFVGRDDVLQRLEELWAHSGECPSVILYGHRRMGKTSILLNLGERFGATTVIVNFSMQLVGKVSSNGKLLYTLAVAMYDEWYDKVVPHVAGLDANSLAEPQEEPFLKHPQMACNRFLNQLGRVRGDYRFIITLDEFELLEEQMNEGRISADVLDYWRGTFQTYPWFIMAFAGLHTLEEMRHDYWNPLFSSIRAIEVSFLSLGAARKLITQPAPDFALDYDEDAINRIIALTRGQPYLVQLICHSLVARFNRRTFEQGIEQSRRFTLADVEEIITAPEFFNDGSAYFDGVWRQDGADETTDRKAVLQALGTSGATEFAAASLTLDEIVAATGLTPAQVQAELAILQRHDIVEQRAEGGYAYAVELMWRWAVQQG